MVVSGLGEFSVLNTIFTVLATGAFALISINHAHAGSPLPPSADDAQLASLPQTDGLVDALAAEFFEEHLRLSQSRLIEAETAKRYLSLDASEKARFRAERKQRWREMSANQKSALRGVKRPSFANLDSSQKQTFRRIASETLGAAASGDRSSLGDI